ncbi:low temperature requirement protein A [Actinomadura soli]|uniref:Low temperature requirement protein A n=1 Tax=Actinomadura soli TaxID=2508997 RepID=A0A5C4J294_9ACTN|nr:low temperature requirement protein A [Actinomadura soli]
MYFSEPAGEGLAARREWSFVWGYGHYVIFAALAAVGAGLEVAVVWAGDHIKASEKGVITAVAVPIAVVLVMLWILHAPMRRTAVRPELIGITAALALLTTFAAPTLGVAGCLVLLATLLALLIAATIVTRSTGRAGA